jgi:uncharacterized protein GlcG (DUF336 family)
MTSEPTANLHNRRDALRMVGAAGIALGAAAAPAARAAAQDATPTSDAASVTKRTIALETAMALIAAAHAKATDLGVPMAVAVVDEGGLLKAFGRMDGVNSAATVDIVQMKAYSAASFRTPTHQIAEGVMENGPRAASLANIPRFTLLGGGFPIKDGDVVIGGLGVGGGSPDQDVEVGEAALAAVFG